MTKFTILIGILFISCFQSINAQTFRYVDSSVAMSGNGTSWNTAYKTLSEALNSASLNSTISEIHIAKGTYYPHASTDRDASFTILRGKLKLYGGYAPGGVSRGIYAYPTILSGDIGIRDNVNDNSYHVMVIAGLAANSDSVVVDGLNFQWGRAAGTSGSFTYNGKSIPRTDGGGIAISGNANSQKIIFNNCKISANYASNVGAGIFVDASVPVFMNTLFSGNYANYGGAAFNGSNSDTRYINCTIAGNRDNNGGGGMRNSSSNPVIINTIIYGNNGGISNNSATPVISYSLVQGITSTTNGNLNGNTQNPAFVAPVAAGTANIDGDYRLKNTSPCLNKGDNTPYSNEGGKLNTDIDMWGNKRLWALTIDMGANEHLLAIPNFNIIYVKKGNNGTGTGNGWNNAMSELADALKAAKTQAGIQKIFVAGGTYSPLYSAADINFGTDAGRDNAFLLVKDVEVYGGFRGTENYSNERNLNDPANETILSGDIDASNSINDNDAYHIVISSGEVGNAVLDGFTLSGAKANGTGSISVNGLDINRNQGAGFHNYSSSPAINNTIIKNNIASAGAGMLNTGVDALPVISYSKFIGNQSSGAGAGLYQNSPTEINISYSIFLDNNSGSQGGAIFINNSAGSLVMLNSLIAKNIATGRGGAIANWNGGKVSITNCTIADNTSISESIYNNLTPSSPNIILNSIIWGVNNGLGGAGTPNVNYSLVKGVYAGTSNLNVDPNFSNPASNDYSLKASSFAINWGNNESFPGLDQYFKDIKGNNRVYNFSGGGVIDIGAYEFQGVPVFPITYVKVGGTGNGSSWDYARGDLQEVLITSNNNSIWVAKGTYKPTPNSSFKMKNDVKIYGGFNDTGNPGMEDRNYKLFPTILQGNGIGVVDNDYTSSNPLNDNALLDGFTITGGNTTGMGGGIRNVYSSATFSNLIIKGNTAMYGGGFSNERYSPKLINVCINSNSATQAGGGVFNIYANIGIINCTISGNINGELYSQVSDPLIRNSIIYGNGNYLEGNEDIENSLFQGFTSSEKGNIYFTGNVNSIFLNPANKDYNLIGGSLVINAGKNSHFPNLNIDTKDLAGNQRAYSQSGIGVIDMGAYEYQGNSIVPIRYVKAGGTGNGSSWANATGNLQAAINADGVQQVWVAKGNFTPPYGSSFKMKNNVSIFGGFNDNGNPQLVNRNSNSFITTLTASSSISVIRNVFMSSSPLLAGAVLDGFTITGANHSGLGGGIYNENSSPTLSNLIIAGNSAISGGGIYNANSSPFLINILITNNWGGGIYNDNNSSPFLTNVTISGNSGNNKNEFYGNSTLTTIRNSIIYGTGVTGVINNCYNSIVQGANSFENGNIVYTGNPTGLFENPAISNFNLVNGSFAINAGNNSFIIETTDLAFQPRIYNQNTGGIVDIGAYEYQGNSVIPIRYVKPGGTGNGATWATSTRDLQASINAAGTEQVWVAKGTHTPPVNGSFKMKNNVSVYGGFNDIGAPVMKDRDWHVYPTTLQGIGSVVISNDYTSAFPLNSGSVLDGFIITGGNSLANGGGIFNKYASPTLSNLKIIGNSANNGGAIYNENSSPVIKNAVLYKNTALNNGGAIYNSTSSPVLTNVTISGNNAILGAEFYNNSGTPEIQNSIIYGNGIQGILNNSHNSLLQGNAGTTNGNIAYSGSGADLFSDPVNDNYTLKAGSAAINNGDNSYYSELSIKSKDLNGLARVDDYENSGIIDMGAFEFSATNTRYVKPGGTGNGFSWSDATGDLQFAINSYDVKQVWVAKGTYQPVLNTAFVMKNNVEIYGGFNDTGNPGMADRNWKMYPSILKGNGERVIINTFTAANPLIRSAVLDGFIITGGYSQFGRGGGIYNWYASPTLKNLVIKNNHAYLGGGFHDEIGSSPLLINVLVTGNSANQGGGSFQLSANPELINVTISGNTAATDPEWRNQDGNPIIRNSIIYGERVDLTNLTNVQNSIIKGFNNSQNGNIIYNGSVNDLFVDTSMGDYSLKTRSNAINAGNNNHFPDLNSDSKDLGGQTRVFDYSANGIIDIGAYEYMGNAPTPIIYVKVGGTGDGSSWAEATSDLQAALSWNAVEQVWVAKGTYTPQQGTSFAMKNNVAIYGGFPDTGNPGMVDRDWKSNLTTLNGNGAGVIRNIFTSALPLQASAILDGFTITNGNTLESGGGINNTYASPTLSNLIIKGNYNFNNKGGGIYNNFSSPKLTNVIISGNEGLYGGGMYNESSSPVLVNVLIHSNMANNKGGGIYNNLSSPVLTNVTISRNNSYFEGSGIYNSSGTPVLRNSIVYSNSIYGTITDYRNCILSEFNSSQNGNIIFYGSEDALFVDASNKNFTLAFSSPAINAGSNSHFTGLNANSKDLAGNERVFDFANGGVIDIGAYETLCSRPSIPNNGHPLSQTLCEGATILPLQVTATGGSLTYQWFLDNNFSGYSSIANETNTLFTPANNVAGTKYYYVKVSNYCGSVNSNKATIIINPLPQAPGMVPGYVTICKGSSTVLNSDPIHGIVTIGMGDRPDGTSPYNGSLGGFKAQYLYSKAELLAKGIVGGASIYSLGMDITAFSGSFTFRNLSIKMMHTNITSIGPNPNVTDVTTVLGPVDYNMNQNAPFSITHDLSTMFQWNGNSNILVEFCYDNNGIAGTPASGAKAKSSYVGPFTAAAWTNAYTSNICSSNSLNVGSAIRPDMTFGYTSSTPIFWSPSTGLNHTDRNTVIANPSSTTMYTATATNSFGCTKSNVVMVTVNSIDVTISETGPIVLCTGATKILTAQTNASSPTYQWKKDGLNITGATNSTYTVSGSGIYTVSATSESGCSATSASVEIIFNLLPEVSIAETGPITFCLPASQILTAQTNASSPSYQWQNGGVNISGAKNSTYTVTASGNYTVTVTSVQGCYSTSGSATVTVNPLPAQIVFTPAAPVMCSGSNVVVGATSGSSSISWSPAEGLNTTIGNTVTASPAGTSTYTATATTNFGCQISNNITVVVTPALIVGAAITGPTNACAYMGSGSQLAVYSVTATNAGTYTWTIPAGALNVTGQGTNTISFNYPISFTSGDVSVSVAPMAPCSTSIVRTLAISHTVPAAPVVSGIVNVCNYVGTGVELTYTAAPDPNVNSYVWSVGPQVTIVSGQGTNSINVTLAPGFTNSAASKQIRVTSMAACGSSELAIFYLAAQLPQTARQISGPTELCSYVGTSTQATYSISDVTSALSYMWTVPTGATIVGNSTGTSINVVYDNSFTGGYVSVRAVNTCGTSGVRSLPVKRTTPSMPGLINGPRNICLLLPSVANPNGLTGVYSVSRSQDVTYVWTVPEGIVIESHNSTATEDAITVSFNSNYSGGSISVHAVGECGTSAERVLTLSQLTPGSVGGILQLSAGSCEDRTYTYGVASMPSNATSLEWTVPEGGTIISGQGTTTITVVYTNAALAGEITATGNNGCGNSSRSRTFAVKLGGCTPPEPMVKVDPASTPKVELASENLDVKVYPNPSVTTFRLKATSNNLNELIQVKIVDNLGRQQKILQMRSGETISFGSELKAGSYFVEVMQGKQKTVKKVLKF